MSKAARQRSARERLAEERRRQAQRQQRARALTIAVSALAIVALAVVVVVFIVNKKDKDAYQGALPPAARQSDGAILMGRPGAAAPKLEVFEDFQCPICGEFEKATGNTLKRLAAAGKVNVFYYPFWLFKQQQEPVRGNSLRAANAALCAPADKWIVYHDKIYKNQPEEGTKGFSSKDLTGWAKDVGVATPAFERCVKDVQKQSQVDQMTAYAGETRKVTGTPTVFLNGQALDLNSTLLNAKNLEKAILSAPPAATPSVSAPATASPSAAPKK